MRIRGERCRHRRYRTKINSKTNAIRIKHILRKTIGEEGTKEDNEEDKCEEEDKSNGCKDKGTIGFEWEELEGQEIKVDEDEWGKSECNKDKWDHWQVIE